MASQDAHPEGGSITDMAVEGTTVPEDAAKQRTIPSVPRPGQITDPSDDPNNYGAPSLAGAADNAQDISRVRATLSLVDEMANSPIDNPGQSTYCRRHHRHRRFSPVRSRLETSSQRGE